jgi:hypothetical protein
MMAGRGWRVVRRADDGNAFGFGLREVNFLGRADKSS